MVAILVLLMAILTPSLRWSRVLVMRARCASNLHQCHTALSAYAAGNSGRLVPHRRANDMSTFVKDGGYDLRDYIEPYLHDLSMWQCPNTTRSIERDCEYMQTRGKSAFYASYSYLAGLSTFDFGPIADTLASARPGIPLMQDQVRDHRALNRNIWTNHPWEYGTPSRVTEIDQVEGVNLLFFDGGVRWLGGEQLAFVGYDNFSGVSFWSVAPPGE